jgi:hypothetical protein
MSKTITLSASARYGYGGKQFIARITGRDKKFTFEREFIGKKVGKRGEDTSVVVDEPGLYVERNIDSKGRSDETYQIIWRDGDKLRLFVLDDISQAMGIATEIGDGADPTELGRRECLVWLRSQQQEAAAKDPEEKFYPKTKILELDETTQYTRREIMARRAEVIARLEAVGVDGARPPKADWSDLSSVSTDALLGELTRRGITVLR